MGPVHRADRAAELALVRTNVEAVVDLCTLFVPGMVTRHRGAVLNTASTAAFQPLPGQAGYGASKAFVLSYGRAMGAELRGTGVTVTTLCPGPVETGFAEAAGMTDDEAGEALPKFMWLPAARRRQGGRRRPRRRARRRDPGGGQSGRGVARPPGAQGLDPSAHGPAPPGAETGTEALNGGGAYAPMPTTGLLSRVPPSEPEKTASPFVKMPPSEATSQ